MKKLCVTGLASLSLLGFSSTMVAQPTSQSVEHQDHTGHQLESAQRVQYYTCSMHPQIRSTDPAARCPICGMSLVPVKDEAASTSGPAQITLSASALKLAEVETAPVTRGFPSRHMRLFGEVAFDETLVSDITAYFSGRVEKLYVNYTGLAVRKGDHLAEIYSPDLITAQQELQQALRSARNFQSRNPGPSSQSSVALASQATLEAVRDKLRLWGLSAAQIRDLETRQKTAERFTLYSPQHGIVIEKAVKQGQYLETGQRLFQVASTEHLWVTLEAYESQLPWLRYGQDVAFTIDANPGKTWHGRVAFIDPVVNPQTRTASVRLNVRNENDVLKPGMFVRATVQSDIAGEGKVLADDLKGKHICPMHPEIIKDKPGSCDICGMDLVPAESMGYFTSQKQQAPLLIPVTAPLITGKRAVVYVRVPDQDKPTFEGREVVLGPRADDAYIVLEGLHEGEQVVVKGAFRIDSAMQINAMPSMMSPTPASTAPADPHAGHQHP